MRSRADIKAIASNVIHIPREFWKRGNVSVFSLLKESGYFELFDQLTQKSFQDVLQVDQQCIQDWLQFSSDKRTSFGWYFKKNVSGTYIVGRISGPADEIINLTYNNPVIACATFVKHEIECIRAGDV
jgi:hypothetical protein